MNIRKDCFYGQGLSSDVFPENLIRTKLLLVNKYMVEYEKSPSHTVNLPSVGEVQNETDMMWQNKPPCTDQKEY